MHYPPWRRLGNAQLHKCKCAMPHTQTGAEKDYTRVNPMLFTLSKFLKIWHRVLIARNSILFEIKRLEHHHVHVQIMYKST